MALACGLPHPDFLLPYMSSKQLREAEIYYSMDPYGEKQGYRQAASVCSVIANVNRDSKRKPIPYKTEDFMPQFGGRKNKKQTVNEMNKILFGMSKKGSI
ncbi:MAG: DUF4035 domain-containing protein [Gammaproteobacteria bacterium]|nr:DUF4035 domain-containing protein [Gammaproteobacteria bacterium]